MTDRRTTVDRIVDGGVIAVLRGVSDETLEPIATAIADGGITAIEVTADTADVTGKIDRLSTHVGDRDALIGAGTILDAATASAVSRAGAEFIVTPTLSAPVMETANREGLPVVPGIMTPTEAQQALELGTDVVKLFPAQTVGPGHIGAIQGPLAQVDVIPTGGVTLENAASYIEAGGIAVGVGSALVTDDILATEDWQALEDRSAAFVEAVETARN